MKYKHSEKFYSKSYASYVQEMNRMNSRLSEPVEIMNYSDYKTIVTVYEGIGLKANLGKYIARDTAYKIDYNTARAIRKKAQSDPEFGDQLGSIKHEKISDIRAWYSTSDIAEMLDLDKIYHQKIAEGMTPAEAKHYVSWYYFGSK